MRRSPLGLLLFLGPLLIGGCTPRQLPAPTWEDAPLSMAGLMVEVPGGEFLYGKDKQKRRLDRFWIDRLEVTNTQYGEFVRVGGAKPPWDWNGPRPLKGEEMWPVRYIPREDAFRYAWWLGKDLPTEEEWEKAARGTDGRLYPWGDGWDPGKYSYYDAGHMLDASDGVGYGPVGMHIAGASPFGVEDMLGNAMEWTKSDMAVPQERGLFAVVRGGFWRGGNVEWLTTTARWAHSYGPGHGYMTVGFRCVRRTPPDASARAAHEDGG